MAFFVPRFERFKNRKPPQFAEIKEGHELAENLNVALLFNDGIIDLVNQKQPSTIGGDAKLVHDGIFFDEVGDYIIIPNVEFNADYTFTWHNDFTDNDGTVFQYFISTGGFGAQNSINIYLNEATNFINYAGDSSTPIETTASWPTHTDYPMSLVVQGQSGDLYANGELEHAQAVFGSSPIAAGTVKNLYLGGRSDLNSARFFGGTMRYLFLHDSAPDAELINTLHEFPFQILKERRKYFVFSAAVAITGSGALQAEPASISGSGFRKSDGQGNIASQTAAVSGTGFRKLTGIGALASDPSIVSGAGFRKVQGAGSLESESGLISGSGSVGGDIDGSGSLQSDNSIISGLGFRKSEGSGSLNSDASDITGTGFRNPTGSGVLISDVANISGVGFRKLDGAGVLQAESSIVVGAGDVGGAINGTGALVAGPFVLVGTGFRKLTGQGLLESGASLISGSGVIGGIELLGKHTVHSESLCPEMDVITIAAKRPTDTVLIGFDFTSLVSSIDSAIITVQTIFGDDLNPDNITSGLPIISGSVVSQTVTNGLEDNIYRITADIVSGGQPYTLICDLPVYSTLLC